MNDINQKQITDKNLARIFYFRKMYSHCKLLRGITLFLELSLIVWALFYPLPSIVKYKKETVFITIFFIALIAILKYIQSNLKEKSTLIQDLFDRELFGMKWNKARGTKPSEKEIIAFKNKHYQELLGDDQELVDWYVDVKDLPKNQAVALCQKDNIAYESSNRKFYNRFLFFTIVVTVCLGVYVNMNRQVVDVLLGAIPFMPLCFDMILRLRNSIETRKYLETIDSAIEEVLRTIPKAKSKSIKADLDHIQSSIFDYRKTVEPVPDWIFWWRRKTEHKNRDEYFRDLKK